MSRKAGKAGLAVTVLAVTLYGCGGGGDDDADRLNALQDAFGDATLTPAALTAQMEQVNALQGALDALDAALPADHELSADTIMALVGMSEALAALTTANGGSALTPMALRELMGMSDDLMALEAAAAAAGLDLTPMLIGALSNASEALAALTAANGGVALTAMALGELMTASSDLMALEAAAAAAGVDLTPEMIGALSEASDALAALTTANGGVALTAMALGELIAASASATELAGTLAGLTAANGGVEPTPTGIMALLDAAAALTALREVQLQPGQSLDATTLASLVETAAAHATLIAVVAAANLGLEEDDSNYVMLTRAGLTALIAAFKADTAEDVADKWFRARSVAKKLVRETLSAAVDLADEAEDDPAERTRAQPNDKHYQPGPDELEDYLAAAVAAEPGVDPTQFQAPNATPAEVLSSYNVMRFVVVDPVAGDHIVDLDGNPAVDANKTDVNFGPAGMAAPALHTKTGWEAVWQGRIVNRVVSGGKTENVAIYSDIEAPMPETFKEAYGDLDDAQTYDKIASDDLFSEVTGSVSPAPGVTTYHGMQAPDRIRGADATDADQGNSASRTAFWKLVAPSAPNSVNAPFAPEATFAGSFDGVPGTFECVGPEAGTGCSVRVRQDTDASAPNPFHSDEMWVFTAEDSSATVDTARRDGDYLTMGFWLMEPDNPQGSYSYSPYYAGRDVFDPEHVAGLMGTATYSGPAVGKYAMRVFNKASASKGIFTADASLSVNFEDEATSGGLPGDTIRGAITNFVSADHDLGNWRVVLLGTDNLGVADFATGDTPALIGATPSETGVNEFAGIGGAANGRDFTDGTWSGRFFGNDRDSDATHPTSVAGQFEASWGTPELGTAVDDDVEIGFVGVSGVFGAEKTK